jgi:hypothetical protein
MRNEMEIAAVTHVAVVDEHDVFVLVHMECECEEWNVKKGRGRGRAYSLNELQRRTVRQLRLRERVIVREAAPSGVFVV